MKTAVLILAFCAICSAQTYPRFKAQQQFRGRPTVYQNTFNQQSRNQYAPSGQYFSDANSQYTPDTRGQYQNALNSNGQYQRSQYQSGQYNKNQYPTNGQYQSGQYQDKTSGNRYQYARQYANGRYQKTGPYTNFGQFYNGRDNNLQYQHEGRYYHDETGRYVHDDSGAYVHQDVPYVHQDNPYIHQDNPYTHVEPKYVAPKPRYTGPGIPPAGGYGPPVQLRKGNAAGLYDNRNYRIIQKIEDIGDEEYHYLYETENKIYGEEQGQLYNKGSKEEAIRAKGYYEYTGPDSNIYRVDYTADENGFIPLADHVPTPPPIPKAIERALAYKKSIGELKK